MTDDALIHTHLDGITDYSAALDTLCRRAQHNLYLFENNFDGLGFNSEARYDSLRHFLLANPANRLHVLTHDTHYLSTLCPRMTMLLHQFDDRMFIHQTSKILQHITAPFSVADNLHYVRRFHFDDPRGIFAQNDPENARALTASFMEMWSSSHSAISTTRLGL
ncbi:DUF7931 domain-containing protein [Gallionella capsiferriformans]|jgi:hypothetical protein|uniref:DUF7931 domain-containing protein n=1 Tax=Gallionella capsiferriformans (strain ES-2) TaxID=395494 RepID=D9SIN9_GALCS|nr:hypothetical protein [Gallionella capsiferriformans]ADL56202.1 hypothetical protein Galf_2198 [Gallionella capsiferriformans ES-2]